MSESAHLLIQPLGSGHDRKSFACGTPALDDYLRKQAGQDLKRRICRVFVATADATSRHILGYYTLSALAIDLQQLPAPLAQKLPRHPVPTALLGRLAVAQTVQGAGIGKMLLADAVKRTLAVSTQLGIYALVVDAIDDPAQAFYQQFGFTRLAAAGQRLFLPLKSVGQQSA